MHGGRNDIAYSRYKMVALGDLHILDLQKMEWQQIAMYGDVPQARWGHQMLSNGNQIIIFGGMDLTSFCESMVYEL